MVAHLEDQLQERKMKKSLQEKYVKKSTQLLVYQGQKLNSHNEGQLAAEIEASVCLCLCVLSYLIPSERH